MITISWQALFGYIIAGCAGFATVCVAVGWLIKIIKAVKKPGEDIKTQMKSIDAKLDNDNKRIRALEDQTAFILKAISLLLQDDLAILEHLRTDNNTGKMAEQEAKVQEFLIQR